MESVNQVSILTNDNEKLHTFLTDKQIKNILFYFHEKEINKLKKDYIKQFIQEQSL